MIIVAWIIGALLLLVAALVRAGTASLVRTPRADALRSSADGMKGADSVANLLEDRSNLQPSLGTTVTFLIVVAVIPLTWAITDTLSGAPLAFALIGMAIALVLLVDVIPRWIGRNRPGSLAYRLVGSASPGLRLRLGRERSDHGPRRGRRLRVAERPERRR